MTFEVDEKAKDIAVQVAASVYCRFIADPQFCRAALPFVAALTIGPYWNMANHEPYRHIPDYSIPETVIEADRGDSAAGPFYTFQLDCSITTTG